MRDNAQAVWRDVPNLQFHRLCEGAETFRRLKQSECFQAHFAGRLFLLRRFISNPQHLLRVAPVTVNHILERFENVADSLENFVIHRQSPEGAR
jgi:hypothetical protein